MMKEKATIPKRVKGTVLFTVVAVMMVMVVMLTATLALATTANNRAMNNYNQAQTQAAAKSAVEAILSAMQNDGDLAQDANSLSGGSAPIKIDNVAFYGESTLGSMGHLKDAAIEYYGTKYILNNDSESDTYGQMEAANVLKVWATVEQGGQDSTYAAYVMNGSHSSGGGGGGGGGGFVTTGTAVNGTKTSAFGGTYIGYSKQKDPITNKYIGADMWAQNTNTVYETPFAVNGNVRQQTGIDYVVRGKKQGVTVWGSYYIGNGDMGISTVNANNSNDFATQLSYTDIPYFYVENVLATGSASTFKYSSAFDIPINLFCGQLVLNKDADLSNMNVYCYTPYDGTNLKVEFKKETGTVGATENFTKGLSEFNAPNFGALYNWTVSVLDVNGSSVNVTSGNYYTKGNLKVASNNAKFAKNVYVDGDMEVTGGNCEVGGDVYVAGTFNGNIKLNGGTLYCDNIVGNVNNGNKAGLRVGVDPSKTVAGHSEPKPGYTSVTYGGIFKRDNVDMGGWSKPVIEIVDSAGNILWSQDDWSHNAKIYDNTSAEVPDNTLLDTAKTYFTSFGAPDWAKLNASQCFYTVVTDPSGNVVDPSEGATWIGTSFYAADGTYLPLPYGNPIDAETFFPEEYEKDVVTGITTIDSLKSLPAEDYKQKTQIVQTVEDVMNGNINPYNTEYEIPTTYQSEVEAHQYNLNNPSTWDTGISFSGNEYIITNSCKIEGNAGSARVTFKVPANQEFWVEVVGNGLHFNNDGCLRQDTSSLDMLPVTPSDKPGKLNILLNANTNMSNTGDSDLSFAANNNNIPIATTYVESLIKTNAEFQLYTDASYEKTGVPTIKEIPLSIYAGKSADPASNEPAHRLIISNQALIVANICAPYLDYYNGSKSWDFSNTVYYNKFPVRGGSYPTGSSLGQVSVIGCCNVAQLSGQANDFLLLYVPRELKSGGPKHESDDDVMTNWKIQFYENY